MDAAGPAIAVSAGIDAVVGALAPIIEAGGPPLAIAAGVVVGLGLLVILLARLSGLVAAGRTDRQGAVLQARLLSALTLAATTEEQLRQRLDKLLSEKSGLQDEVMQLRVSLTLVRNQRRKLIEVLREVKSDRLGPAALRAAGIEVGA